MNKRIINTVLLFICCAVANAQDRIPTSNMWLKAYPVGDIQVPYKYDGTGPEYKVSWGMDVAWNDGNNVKRGVNYIGVDLLTTGRVSFQPTYAIGDDLVLSSQQISAIKSRIQNIGVSNPSEGVMLNLDIPAELYDEYRANYKGKPYEYYKVIKASVLKYNELGMKIISIAPFNEPDYTYNEVGTQAEFRKIAEYIANDPDLAGIRISAGNTLNDDRASEWYNYMKPYVNEGNTHQLAGNFDNYVNFFKEVRNDGNHATADELHNTMEAFVATHYGLQTGIWWGYDGLCRGDYCKAAGGGGQELGYAENRNAWAAGCVYRLPNGSVEAFAGVSERQANKNTMDFVSTDRDVYYEGYGPVRLYNQFLPGDGVYGSDNQKNAERVIHILNGDDVPLDTIGGEYIIMNKKTSKIICPVNTSSNSTIQQYARRGRNEERWNITPTSHLKGGDFSYYHFKNNTTGYYMNLLNNNVDAFGTFVTYNAGGGDNEQYCFEYAGDGWYYIRNHLSGLYLETSGTTVIRQNVFKGSDMQKWRLMPVDAKCEQTAPAVPVGLQATGNSASVLLSWDANTDKDFNCYIVLRGHKEGDETRWETIGRRIADPVFIDNSCVQGESYVYKIQAVDLSGNRSAACDEVSGAPSGEQCLIAEYEFDESLIDNTVNQFDAVSMIDPSFSTLAAMRKSGSGALNLNGKNYLMIPPSVADLKELTISSWFYNGDINQNWGRLFDFGNGTDQYMFFTPNNGSEARFVIKNGGSEQILSTNKISTGWKYVTVTMNDSEVKLYINGEVVASSTSIDIRPSDFHPSLCYIGRSQFVADPLLKGRVDDFRIYNYALSQEEIKADMDDLINGMEGVSSDIASPVVSTEYYTLGGVRISKPQDGIYIIKQRHADGSIKVKKVF